MSPIYMIMKDQKEFVLEGVFQYTEKEREEGKDMHLLY